MPSRRQVLAATGTAVTVGGLTGCVSAFAPTEEGHLQLKAVSVEWTFDGQTYRDEPLQVLFDIEDTAVTGRYDPRVVGESVRGPGEVVVTDATHDRLTARFDVRYLIGVCGSDFADPDESYGCLNTWTGREDFNSAQFTDRVRVKRRDASLDVVGVSADEYEVSSTTVREFDFLGLHRDDGLDPGDW